MASSPDQLDVLADVTTLMDKWNKECFQGSATPVEILVKLCEIIEMQTEVYYKTDPDPFDDRHPGRADPNCTLGHVLKIVLKNEDFLHAIARTYLSREQPELNSVTCRLLLNVMPGLEAIAVFKEHESSISKFFTWAENGAEPIRSYSIGILSFIMEGQEHASTFKENNHKLVPILMKRLHKIIQERIDIRSKKLLNRPFVQFGSTSMQGDLVPDSSDQTEEFASNLRVNTQPSSAECNSNSSWQEMEPYLIQSHQIYPVTEEVQQRLILSYLTPMAEYQELLPEVFQNKAMDLVFYYLDYQRNCDVRLSFAAVRYLASLLCHKKFGIEFINCGGLQKFLTVPRPSLAATGVSLCLYYLAFFEDTMERVCMTSLDLLTSLTEVVLWLLECSHQSGRMHAVMFLSFAMTFKAFLDIFDQMDGLRKLYNVLSTSEILNVNILDNEFSDDQMYVFKQAIKHVTFALKKYFESHVCVMADRIKTARTHSRENSPTPEITPYKTMKLSAEALSENVELLLECLGDRYWKPAASFLKLGGVNLCLKTMALISEWPAYTGKADSVRWLLDTLAIATTYPLVQLELCKNIQLLDGTPTSCIRILLSMADNDILCESEVQKSALAVIINLVCAPSDLLNKSLSLWKAKRSHSSSMSSLQTVWDEFRQNNGIMVLLKLIQIQSPLSGADAIRALACKALVGLSRSDTMCQIMSKLPLFNNGQIQSLMKEPVLQDKRGEHVKFCKYGTELIERVCGRPQNVSTDITLDHIRKADVVAQTKIVYKEKELLQLIYDHLVQNGLEQAAHALQKEANITVRSSPLPVPHLSQIYDSPISSKQKILPGSKLSAPATPGPSASSTIKSSPITPGGLRFQLKTPANTSQSSDASHSRQISSLRPGSSKQDIRQLGNSLLTQKKATLAMTAPSDTSSDSMTLDKIITSYFRKQHALCKNPVVTCPPFSLYEPHFCPEPDRKIMAPSNLTSRILRTSVHPPHGGHDGASLNRKFKFSRFKPVKTYKDTDGSSSFSCCSFSACEQWLMLGTNTGDLKLFSLQTGEEAETYNCHHSPLVHTEASRDGLLLLTSSSWGRPLSALWTMDNFFDQKIGFDQDNHVEFSKVTQDRIVGTYEKEAKIYDVATGEMISKFYDENKANEYLRNQATFNCTDDLLLNDGVLWDVNSRKVIHKFDKFNPYVSGLFHPLGLEVIINSEIWDLRTFKLLHTVPALNQCQIRFTNDSSVIYGAVIPYDEEEEDQVGTLQQIYGSSFRTFDARTYECLATIDVKKSIYDLCTDKSDMYLAVIETQRDSESLQEDSTCRLYEVGAIKTEEELAQEDDEDDDQGDEDDDDDDDDEDDGEDGDPDEEAEILELIDENDAEDDESDEGNNDLENDLTGPLDDQRDLYIAQFNSQNDEETGLHLPSLINTSSEVVDNPSASLVHSSSQVNLPNCSPTAVASLNYSDQTSDVISVQDPVHSSAVISPDLTLYASQPDRLSAENCIRDSPTALPGDVQFNLDIIDSSNSVDGLDIGPFSVTSDNCSTTNLSINRQNDDLNSANHQLNLEDQQETGQDDEDDDGDNSSVVLSDHSDFEAFLDGYDHSDNSDDEASG